MLMNKNKPNCATLRVVGLTIVVGLLSAIAVSAARPAGVSVPYEATTESLRKHKVAKWYEDAKFGIFIHWGVFSVPAYHEWYVEFISPKSNYGFLLGGPPYTATCGNLPEELCKAHVREDAVKYHLAHWGPDFAYDDFIPMFKAEKFDPGAWAQLFQESGARYVVLTAKHGDEFALWPTKFTHRNAMDMGPRPGLGRRPGESGPSVRAEDGLLSQHHLYLLGPALPR